MSFSVIPPKRIRRRRSQKKLIIRCQQRCRRRLKRFSTRDKRFFFVTAIGYIRYCVPVDPLSYASLVIFCRFLCLFFDTKLKMGFHFRKSFICDCKFLFSVHCVHTVHANEIPLFLTCFQFVGDAHFQVVSAPSNCSGVFCRTQKVFRQQICCCLKSV